MRVVLIFIGSTAAVSFIDLVASDIYEASKKKMKKLLKKAKAKILPKRHNKKRA